jgi:hypothetical protein
MRYVLPFTSSCDNVDFCSGFICNFKSNAIGGQQWNGENVLRIWFIVYYCCNYLRLQWYIHNYLFKYSKNVSNTVN